MSFSFSSQDSKALSSAYSFWLSCLCLFVCAWIWSACSQDPSSHLTEKPVLSDGKLIVSAEKTTPETTTSEQANPPEAASIEQASPGEETTGAEPSQGEESTPGEQVAELPVPTEPTNESTQVMDANLPEPTMEVIPEVVSEKPTVEVTPEPVVEAPSTEMMPENTAPTEQVTKQACNGHWKLCDRKYSDVSYVTTHNAMSSRDAKFIPPNHYRNIKKQLADGVRGFMLDTHSFLGKPHMCHGPKGVACLIGKRPLVDGLKDLKDFMDKNKNEVLTIIFESYITADKAHGAFKSSGLLSYTYTHKRGTPWPTLRTMIKNNKRMVVFTDNGGGGKYPWYHKVWDHAWETHYSAKNPGDLKCSKNRGSKSNALFILNHFLTNPLASDSLAKKVNFNPFFLKRAQDCEKQNKKLPNFVTVDFYSIGDVFKVVKALNKL